MANVCQKCGVTGYSEYLIYCSQCHLSAEHRYCLDKMPERDVLEVTWSCEQCVPRVAKQCSLNKHNLRPYRKSELLRKRQKYKINVSGVTAELRNREITSILQKEDSDKNEDLPEPAQVVIDRLSDEENKSLHFCNGNSDGGPRSKKQRRKLFLEDEGNSDEEAEYVKFGTSQVAPDIREPAEVTNNRFPHKGIKENVSLHSCDGSSEGGQRSKKQRRKSILEDGGSSDEEAESIKLGTSSQVAPDIHDAPSNISSHQPFTEYQCYVHARPIIDPIWRGCLNICGEKYGTVAGLLAHLSNKACLKVFEGANALPLLLSVKMLPRPDAWPKSFSRSPPTDDNIGLYFFPGSECDRTIFDGLLHDIIDGDLALKAVIGNTELLIFSSLQLPQQYWRFYGRYYLWGVFKGNPVSLTDKPADHLHIQNSSTEYAMPSVLPDDLGSQEGRDPSKNWIRWSPRSPLSINTSNGSDSTYSPFHQKSMFCFSDIFCCDNTEKSVNDEQNLEKQHLHGEKDVRIEACDAIFSHHGVPWSESLDASKEENNGMIRPCLELFPLDVEDIAIVTKVGRSSTLDLELGLGWSMGEDCKDRSPGSKKPMGKSCTSAFENAIFL